MGLADQININDAVEWCGEALELIGSPGTLLEKVVTIEVKETRAIIPNDVHQIQTIWGYSGYVQSEDPNDDTFIDCVTGFSAMQYSSDTMHFYMEGCNDNRCASSLTYMVNDNYVWPNFSCGAIRMSYWAIPTDENGYPKIPDQIKFREAVAGHLAWKLARTMLIAGKMPAQLYQEFKTERDWYIGAAQTAGQMPGLDMMESLKNNWIRLIPKINQHRDAFSSSGTQEQRTTRGNNAPTVGVGTSNNSSEVCPPETTTEAAATVLSVSPTVSEEAQYANNNSTAHLYIMPDFGLSIIGTDSTTKTLTLYSNTLDVQLFTATWSIDADILADTPISNTDWTTFWPSYASSPDDNYEVGFDLAQWAINNGGINDDIFSYTFSSSVSDGTYNSVLVTSTTEQTIFLFPSTPLNLAATSQYEEVGLVWDVVLGASSYVVAYKLATDPTFIEVSVVSATHAVEGLTNGLLYDFKVKAVNSAGESSYTAVIQETPNNTVIPNVPTGLSLVPSDSQIIASWNAASGADSYLLYYKLSSDSGYTLTSLSGLTYTVTGLINDSEYDFKVVAVNNIGNSASSAIVSSTPFAVPEFNFSVKSDNSGVSNDDQYLITVGTGTFLYDVTTDDGYSATGLTGAHTITFPTGAGTHNVTITGDFPSMKNSHGNDDQKLMTIDSLGDYGSGSTSQKEAFEGCSNLVWNATDAGDFSAVVEFTDFLFGTSSMLTISSFIIDLSASTSFLRMFIASGITNFPPNVFDNVTSGAFGRAFELTNLTTQSIDNIFVSLVASGVSNGVFKQSGGQAPSATGLAAKDTLVADGWTIVYTS